MRIDNARRVRALAQEVVRLIDAATARAHRDREAANEYYHSAGFDPLTSLGLALWEHDGAQWLIPTEGRGPDGGRRIIRLGDYSMLWANPESTDDAFDRALASYLAAQTPPEPPQPGERWLLGPDLGSVEQPVEVVEIGGERYFVLPCGTTPTLVHVADRDPSTYRRAES